MNDPDTLTLPFSLLIAEQLEHASSAQLPHSASAASSAPSTLAPTSPTPAPSSPDPGPFWAFQPCWEWCGGGVQRCPYGRERNSGDPGAGDAALPTPGGERMQRCGGVVRGTRHSHARHCAKVTMENQSTPNLLVSACVGERRALINVCSL